MVRTLIAYTSEVDGVDDAIAEILGQVDLNSLSKNSVGLLTCYHEFIDTGVVSGLCERLPFDVIGCTTLANATSGDHGMYMLQLMILTSDDVSFSTGLVPSVSIENYKTEVAAAYREARAKLPGDPSFIISFFPFMPELSSSTLLENFDKSCGGIPIFGTVASDTSMSLDHSQVIWNGVCEKQALAMLLLHGDINAKFIVTSLPERNIRKQKVVITESDGCILKRVNGMPFSEYLKGVGITLLGAAAANALVIPLLIDYGDGEEPVAVGVYNVGEDGSVVCGGEMPQGASFSIGEIDYDGIIETARITTEKILEGGKGGGLIMFPCISRYHMLSPNNEEEIETVKSLLGDKLPYILTYSGGEICPVYDESEKTHNRFHNYTFVACIFQ
ncbi:MAG: FIST C-terminal domain-containing protein [Synergistaceae bacterium]|jgi:hypothetical protein|nr:FIST C-terminal domain-containing protein [Synergistaceae bacterium]